MISAYRAISPSTFLQIAKLELAHKDVGPLGGRRSARIFLERSEARDTL
jgi:hypothetical protein